jgi:hypothetical protein
MHISVMEGEQGGCVDSMIMSSTYYVMRVCYSILSLLLLLLLFFFFFFLFLFSFFFLQIQHKHGGGATISTSMVFMPIKYRCRRAIYLTIRYSVSMPTRSTFIPMIHTFIPTIRTYERMNGRRTDVRSNRIESSSAKKCKTLHSPCSSTADFNGTRYVK